MKNKRWNLSGQELCAFSSEFGAPYGIDMIKVKPGESIDIDLVATDLSIAYVDSKDGGVLKITVDGQVKLEQATNIPYIDSEKKERFIENRKGVLNLGYGIHNVKIEVEKAPVTILGVFSYDSRPNRDFERRLNGIAAAGETIQFSLPFKARPIVKCDGSLIVKSADIKQDQITFSGSGTGSYEVVGE